MNRDVQAIIDRLGTRLSRPTAVDDPQFRLQVYSPQTGPLDDVRITSILFRESPDDAKRWVLAHGIADAEMPVRLPPSEGLGLLPRVCVPIRYEGSLLGYLWVIDADCSMSDDEFALCARVAEELASPMFRAHVLESLDRETERRELERLIDGDDGERDEAATSLHQSGVLSRQVRPIVLVAQVVTADPAGLTDDQAVALELGIERARSLVADNQIAQFRSGDRAIIIVGADDREVRRRGIRWISETMRGLMSQELDGCRLVVGIGRQQTLLSDAVRSYRQARDAAHVLAAMPQLGDIAAVDEVSTLRPLLYVPEEVLEAMIPPPLLVLMRDSDPTGLGRTLEVFLDAAGNVAQTADVLALHRASVYKRLLRIEETLGVALASGSSQRDLHLAYLAARFLGIWPAHVGRSPS